ncbi:hypothetical protein ASPCADRAFT_203438 [Aspergillus carbonarius ITEM 5010]|uniref:Uncharacterized protein n=1 Tax=Aspergillus carbonarius (strain ITEM 5010) TaxID=602072 RepID=A0A1R3RYU3_ASPC5|nr:hypothetical protein ASPCADRAFT_203438 [Aspergillus carbonarius ITEM 5010]
MGFGAAYCFESVVMVAGHKRHGKWKHQLSTHPIVVPKRDAWPGDTYQGSTFMRPKRRFSLRQ